MFEYRWLHASNRPSHCNIRWRHDRFARGVELIHIQRVSYLFKSIEDRELQLTNKWKLAKLVTTVRLIHSAKPVKVFQWHNRYYQVSGSGQHEQGEAEVKLLLDDQVAQEWSQHNPTHTQKVGDCPWVLILRGNIDAQRVKWVGHVIALILHNR